MQNNKNNITLSLIILILSFVNIIFNTTNISALSYQSEIGIGFTFNPTLSVSLSSSDLIISNLTPSSTADSNSINVNVATNASYGYTLSVNANNDNLTHSNNMDTFSSIATDASLQNLTTDNTWGYSTSLDNGSSWSNYNGLSNSTSTTLIDNSNTVDSTDSIGFKIAAKAGNTQASGTYTNTINFIAVSKVAPMSLLDSFIASGAEQLNGYYKMQDMTHDICEAVDIEESELQLIDKQGNTIPLNSETTDLVDGSLSGAYENGYTYTPSPDKPDTIGIYNGLITWKPNNSSNKAYTITSSADWQQNSTEPYSYDAGESYPDSIVTKENSGNHALSGNYYNWTAAIASNDSANYNNYNDATNSICPKGWRLISATDKDIGNLLVAQGIVKTNTSNTYLDNGFNKMTGSPLYFIRSGIILGGTISYMDRSYYWSSTVSNITYAYGSPLIIGTNTIMLSEGVGRYGGWSIRCLAR